MENEKKKKSIIIIIIIFIIIVGTICGILLYSRYVSTKGLEIREYKIESTKISDNFHGLKITHISDIHYKTTVQKKELCNLADKVNLTKPDIVVLTGDLINKNEKLSTEDINDITECMSKISATLGKYAILGDNDYSYSNYNTLLNNIGFINISDNYDLIYKDDLNYILLAGVSSLSNKENTLDEKLKTTYEYLDSNETKPVYSILLVHEPDTIDSINYNFDLVLAGHSLNGQVRLPYIGGIIKKKNASRLDEYYKINETDLYISGGVGTDQIKYRFFNSPSINLYRLTKKN